MNDIRDTNPYAGLGRDELRAAWLTSNAERRRFKAEVARVWANNVGVSDTAVRQHKADLLAKIAVCEIEMLELEEAWNAYTPAVVEPMTRERA